MLFAYLGIYVTLGSGRTVYLSGTGEKNSTLIRIDLNYSITKVFFNSYSFYADLTFSFLQQSKFH
jgi:hypothetical protein